MLSTSFRSRFAGMIGNILEHYDNALFGLLAPFIAPLFFENKDPLTALILTYAILPLGILMRPLGSLFFGWIGDRFGRRQSLFCSLICMAVVTVGIGSLPTYHSIGYWAPLLLALGKMVQSFSAAGESSGGAIFVLENTSLNKRNLLSGIYDASSICGILIASALVTLFSSKGYIENGWRILFWLGGATAVFGVFLRLKAQEGSEYLKASTNAKINIWQAIMQNKRPLLAIIFVSGFSYTTYSLAFTLMNGYVPMVTSLTKTEVMRVNTLLLLADMVLLPTFGYLAGKIGKERLMFAAALGSAICAIPLFYFFHDARLQTVIVIRLVIMTFGVAFAATYHAWTIEQVLPQYRFTILSLGYAIGSQLIGAPTSAACLWLYQKLHWTSAPALYLIATAALAAYAIRRNFKKMVAYS
ncbi:MAG TPA: MFS transporter [Rhabdochlamydiaceae bacterium]|nr:MFS transporter [Rhabdochlamydiaceae bacterium]